MDETFLDFKKKSHLSNIYNKPNQFGIEGIDHLNISSQSKSVVGRFLDPGYSLAFDYPHIGTFKSTLGMGYWLRSKDLDDRIRKLSGDKLKRYVQEHKLQNSRIKNYTAIIAYALWLRVKSREDIVELIEELDDKLTILSYYTHRTSGLRITTNYAPMISSIVKEIISAIKEKREPDFDQFATHKTEDGKDYIQLAIERKRK